MGSLVIKEDCTGIKFTEGNHQYRADGRSVPSVTGIIGLLDKPALLTWAAKLSAQYVIDRIPDVQAGKVKFTQEDLGDIFMKAKAEHTKVSQQAKDIGTQTHDAIERFLKGEKVGKLTKEVKKSFDAFVEWTRAHELGPILLTETVVFHPEHWYGGKLDIFALLNKRRYILDLKTSKSFYEPEMPMQLAAYAKAVERMTGVTVEGAGIIRLDKETGWPQWRDYSDTLDMAFDMFACLARYENLRRTSTKLFDAAKLKG